VHRAILLRSLAAAALGASVPALAQAPGQPVPAADAGRTETADAGLGQTPREKAAAQAADQAKKDVDVAGIHLQVARLYLAGLHGLAGAPSTWDREHGVALFNQAQNALSDADRQLAELQGLAQGNWPEARDPLTRARSTLDRAQGQLRALSVPLRTGGGQDQAGQSVIGEIYKSLDSSRDELSAAARAMGVDPKLRTP